MKLEITESEKEKKISGTLGACFSLLSFPPHLTHTTPPTLAKGWEQDPGRAEYLFHCPGSSSWLTNGLRHHQANQNMLQLGFSP